MKIKYLNYLFPDTGRSYPEGSKLEIHCISPKWADLVFWNKNNQWQYLSTLPINNVDAADVKF